MSKRHYLSERLALLARQHYLGTGPIRYLSWDLRTARERVEAEALKDARLFVAEFREALDPAQTDWDATAWEDLGLSDDEADEYWPIYQSTLVEWTRRLAPIAVKAETLARDTERRGIEEGWAFRACQSRYGCDWEWVESADEPTARVFDCDGNTIDRITG